MASPVKKEEVILAPHNDNVKLKWNVCNASIHSITSGSKVSKVHFSAVNFFFSSKILRINKWAVNFVIKKKYKFRFLEPPEVWARSPKGV